MSSYSLPTIGLRIVKTAVTAFLIMFLFRILHLGRSPFYAMIASILSMQSDLSNSKRTALNRAFGTTVPLDLWFYVKRLTGKKKY